MQRLILLAFTALISLGTAAVAAEPEVYYFGAAGCEFCANGLSYLKRLQAQDERLRLTTFDIVANDADAGVFVSVTKAIGLSDPQVPMTVIGHHIIIGFEGDETTGSEIASILESCRRSTCPDVVRSILGHGGDGEMVSNERGWVIERRFAKASSRH